MQIGHNTRNLVAFVVAAALVATGFAQERSRADRRTPVVAVFENAKDAVVNIATTRLVSVRSPFGFGSIFGDRFNAPRSRSRRVSSVGSGFLIHPDGYVVTNAHVVDQTLDIKITSPLHDDIAAVVVAVDSDHDLAVLKMQDGGTHPFLKLGRSSDIMTGETVISIGNPFGLQHSVTTGIVSALGRDIRLGQDSVYRNLIQTDAAINPGNSGGPLLNVNSELIGVTTAIRGDAQNIGFAIPVDRLWELLPTMLDIERRERVSVGLDVNGPSSKIVRVRPNTPAASAGLKTGDRVVGFNGERLANGIDYYVRLMEQRPGDTFQLDIDRDGRTIQVSVPLEIVPMPDGAKLADELLGVELSPVSARLRRELELPAYAGLVVSGLRRGGAGQRALVERGDIILRVDGTPVTTLDDVGMVMEKIRRGETVVVSGWRWKNDPPFSWAVKMRVGK